MSTRLRVLVALDPADPRREVLDAAASLCRGVQMELEGLFVEDTSILRLGELSFAREVAHATGAVRSLNTQTLDRQLRAQAMLVRKTFESAARQLGVRHSFRILRGEVLGGLEERAGKFDIVVVGKAGRHVGQRSWLGKSVHRLATLPGRTVVFVQGEWRTGRSVVVVADGQENVSRALQLATKIARADDLPLVILGAAREGSREAALQSLSVRPTQVGFRPLWRMDTNSLIEAAVAEDARVLVLTRPLAEQGGDAIAGLLERIESSVVLTGEDSLGNVFGEEVTPGGI